MCRCFCNCKILHARPCCVFMCCILLLIAIIIGVGVAYYWPEISGAGNRGKVTWNCTRTSCTTCQDLNDTSVDLNSTMCASITYLSEDVGYIYTVTVNQEVLTNETLADLSPPPACIKAPYVEKFARACFRLYDLNATQSNLHVCAVVETMKKLIYFNKHELGCFDIHPIKKHGNQSSHLQANL